MKIRFRVPDPSLNNYDIRRSSSYMSEKKLIYLLSDAIPKITQIDHQNNYGAKTPWKKDPCAPGSASSSTPWYEHTLQQEGTYPLLSKLWSPFLRKKSANMQEECKSPPQCEIPPLFLIWTLFLKVWGYESSVIIADPYIRIKDRNACTLHNDTTARMIDWREKNIKSVHEQSFYCMQNCFLASRLSQLGCKKLVISNIFVS